MSDVKRYDFDYGDGEFVFIDAPRPADSAAHREDSSHG